MFLIINVFFLLVSAASLATTTVLSQTVGAVGGEIVSTRDVQIQVAVEKILFPLKNAKASLFEIHLKDAQFQTELSSTLLELVIQREAESFQVAQPTAEELKEAIQKVEKIANGHSYWTQLELSSTELSDIVKRKLTAKKFIKIKTDLMTSLLTDQDALNYYEKNRLKFGQLPFSNFKENIKTFLSQQQMEERIKTLFEVIKRKYKVRNYLVEGRSIE